MEDIVKVNSNPEFQAFMTYEEDQEKIYNSRMRAATEKGLKAGFEEGLEKGMKQGLEQGLEQGIERGIEQGEKNSKFEIAKKMLDKNFDISVISEITGLDKNEILTSVNKNKE